VIRRYSAVLFVCLFLFSFSHIADAQVYPDREELDVVRLVDGTVLKGVILEEVPERYLEIELYGGSTFVLGFEQIESVEREANPDYGTTWIKVDLDALGTGDEEENAAAVADPEGVQTDPTATDGKGRPFLGQGWLMGPYLTGGQADFHGNERDEKVTPFMTSVIVGIGVHAGYLVPLPSAGVHGAFWGGRGGLELSYVLTGFYFNLGTVNSVESNERDDYEYDFDFWALSFPMEVVIGYGGSRIVGYVGAGGGVTVMISESDSIWQPRGESIEDSTFEFPEVANPWKPFVQMSAGSIVRLGTRMSIDARAFWQWHLDSIFADAEYRFMITPGLSLGVTWHRKEA
jgi:hypothetical protein